MTKRKLDDATAAEEYAHPEASSIKKAKAALPTSIKDSFATGLFEAENLQEVSQKYMNSQPYVEVLFHIQHHISISITSNVCSSVSTPPSLSFSSLAT
jgi:hypothetical protein